MGNGSGSFVMPSPSATLLGKLLSHVAKLRHDALAHCNRLHLGELEAKGADDVLLLDRALALPEQRRLVVVLGEFLRLAADLVLLGRLAETT